MALAGGPVDGLLGGTPDDAARPAPAHSERDPDCAPWSDLPAAAGTLLELCPDAVVIVDRDGRIRAANEESGALFGYHDLTLVGRHVEELMPRELRERHIAARASYTGTKMPMSARHALPAQRADGTTFSVQVALGPVDESSGLTAAVVRDVSDIERYGWDTTRMMDVFSHTEIGLVLADAESGVLELTNPAFDRMHGCEPGALQGQTLDVVFEPGALQDAMDAIATVHYTGHNVFESTHVRADGSAFPVQVDATLIVGPDGRERRAVVVRDVSEEHRQAEASAALAAQVAASESRYRNTLSNLPGIVVMSVDSTRTIRLIDGDTAAFGWDTVDLVGVTAADALRGSVNEEAFLSALDSALAGESAERVIHVRTGRVVHARVAPVWEAGAVVGALGVMIDITKRHEAEARLERLAWTDDLTGLANRSRLLARTSAALEAARATDEQVALLFCDLDDFKTVNDSLGHLVGDRLLVALARRIEDAVPLGAMAARTGGDEFVVLLDHLPAGDGAAATAHRVAEDVIAALTRPVKVNERTLHASGSIGIALSDGWIDAPEDLLRNADTAMYGAKGRGRSRIASFDDALRDRTVARLETEEDLHAALLHGELVTHFQPIVDIHNGRLVGAEALVRWQHPTRGLLGPSEFIDVAEKTGLIVPLGRDVLRDAVRAAARWAAIGSRPLFVSVNVSAAQLGLGGLPHDIELLLHQHDLPTSSVKLELTESTLLETSGPVAAELADLMAMGISIGLDDFGTGYGSLSLLSQMDLSFVKLDRAFVANLDKSPIAASVIDLARALDLEVVAEGVETAAHVRTLRSLRCRLAQGFLYSAALPEDRFLALVNRPMLIRSR